MIKIGVVGMGQMGILHAAIINGLEDSRLVAMCDSDVRLTKIGSKLAQNTRFYTDYLKMLQEESLDGIFICTPVHTHAPIVNEIFTKDKDIALFVEKPLAPSYREALSLAEKISTHVTMVGFQKRFAPTFSKAKEFLQAGVLGELRFFRSHSYTSENVKVGSNWKFERSTGGVTLEFAPHILDLLLWFFGEPLSLKSVAASLHSSKVEDYIHAILEFSNNMVGYLDVSWSLRNFQPGELMIEVHGTNGTLNVTESRLAIYVDKTVPNIIVEGVHLLSASELTPTLPLLVAYPENVLQDQHFIKCVLVGTQPITNFANAVGVNKLIDAIREGLTPVWK